MLGRRYCWAVCPGWWRAGACNLPPRPPHVPRRCQRPAGALAAAARYAPIAQARGKRTSGVLGVRVRATRHISPVLAPGGRGKAPKLTSCFC